MRTCNPIHTCLLFRLASRYLFWMLNRWLMAFFVRMCRYRHTVSLGSMAVMCQFCKPPQALEATKGCADCRSNFCNECFKLYHPWGTPRAQHEHILPTHSFRPKVKTHGNVQKEDQHSRSSNIKRESLESNYKLQAQLLVFWRNVLAIYSQTKIIQTFWYVFLTRIAK